MALSDDNKRGQIGPSLRGLIYQYERGGKFVTSQWPKKRGKKATEKQKLAQQAFKDVMLAMKLTASNIQIGHRAAAHGTPMLPRDTLMAALYGNGPAITYYSGKVIKPMSNRYLSSTVLDALAWEPGQMLWRGTETWEPVPVGLPGQVLQSNGADEAPSWVQPASGGGGKFFQVNTAGAMDTYAYNTKGFNFRPLTDMSLEAVYVKIDLNSSDTASVSVFAIDDDGTITEVVARFPAVITYVSPAQYVRVLLPLAVSLEANQRYAVTISTDGQPDNYATRTYVTAGFSLQIPAYDGAGEVYRALRDPAVGDTLSLSPYSPAAISLELK